MTMLPLEGRTVPGRFAPLFGIQSEFHSVHFVSIDNQDSLCWG